MTDLRLPGQVPAPGFLIVCVKCGFIAEYDCNCDGPFDSRDWSGALHFNTAEDAKNAATALRSALAAEPPAPEVAAEGGAPMAGSGSSNPLPQEQS